MDIDNKSQQEPSNLPPTQSEPIKNNLLNHKGNFLPIVAIVAILVIGVVITFILSNRSKQPQNTYSNVVSPSPIATATVIPSPTPITNTTVVPLANAWAQTKTYANPIIDISFNYPSYFEVRVVDIKKENKDWADKYRNDPNVRQPLYKSNFAASFFTPEVNVEAVSNLPVGVENYRFVCDNKMTVSVSKYDNSKGLSLYDYIAKLNKTYPGDGITESFDTYKKNLTQTSLPKAGSYVFEGIMGENPVKVVYFTNKNNVYAFHLIGNCDTGGQYTKDADKVFGDILSSVKFL